MDYPSTYLSIYLVLASTRLALPALIHHPPTARPPANPVIHKLRAHKAKPRVVPCSEPSRPATSRDITTRHAPRLVGPFFSASPRRPTPAQLLAMPRRRARRQEPVEEEQEEDDHVHDEAPDPPQQEPHSEPEAGDDAQEMRSLRFHEELSWRPAKPIPSATLVARLERLSKELADFDQGEVQLESLKAVAASLAHRNLLQHKDRGVKAYTACCLVDILRLFVPDAPFTDDQLKVRTGKRQGGRRARPLTFAQRR